MKQIWRTGAKSALAATLAAVMLAGCSSAKPTDDPTGESDNSGSSKAPSTYTLYAPSMTTPINLDGEVTQEVMKKSGITWDKVEIGNGSDVTQQINLKLVGGDFPDAIMLPPDSPAWSRLIHEKKLLPLDDYFNDPDKYPNLAKIDKRIIDYWRSDDGHIYVIPSGYELVIEEPSVWQGNARGLWIPNNLLKQVGMEEADLATLEGFENYLKAIKGLKDGQGRSIIPLSLGGENFWGLEVVMSMFGVRILDNGFNELEDGTAIPDYKMPGFKQAFQWLNRLNLEGLLDPETAFQKQDLFKEKVGNQRFGAMLFSGWDNPNVTILKNNNIPEAITYYDLKQKGFPEGWFYPVKLPTISGVKLAQYASYNPFGTNTIGISSKIKDPETMMKGIDWMQTTEAFLLMEYGTESMGAYTLENGAAAENQEVFRSAKFWGGDNGGMASVTQHGFWWWKNFASVGSSHIKTVEPPWPAYNAVLYEAEQINYDQGTHGLLSKASRIKPTVGGAVEKYGPVQNDIRLKYYAKMLLAKNDSEFDNAYEGFLNEMKVRGHDEETVAEFNEKYKTYSATPAGKIEIQIKRLLSRNVYTNEPAIIGE